jgi:hypothetical protein
MRIVGAINTQWYCHAYQCRDRRRAHEEGSPPHRLKTKRAAIEAGLSMLVRVKGQEKMLKLAGKVHWDGDLDEMRRQDRDFDDPR